MQSTGAIYTQRAFVILARGRRGSGAGDEIFKASPTRSPRRPSRSRQVGNFLSHGVAKAYAMTG